MINNKETPANEVPIWTYWTGPQPAWITLCLETMKLHIPNLKILTKESFREEHFKKDQYPTLWEKQRPNVQSDFIRAHQLYHYGGIWCDADCIMFKDISPIWYLLRTTPFLGYRVGPPRPELCSALIASYAAGKLAEHYVGIMDRKMRNHPNGRLGPIALGPNVLRRAAKQSGLGIGKIPTNKIHPIHWNWRGKLVLRRKDIDHKDIYDNLIDDPYCNMLTHRSIGWLVRQKKPQLLAGRTLIHYLFRKALDLPLINTPINP